MRNALIVSFLFLSGRNEIKEDSSCRNAATVFFYFAFMSK